MPPVASSSPLTGTLDGLKRLEAAGTGAVVLPSLFEEDSSRRPVRSTRCWPRGRPAPRHAPAIRRGRLSQRAVPNPAAYERANYLKVLTTRAARPSDGQP